MRRRRKYKYNLVGAPFIALANSVSFDMAFTLIMHQRRRGRRRIRRRRVEVVVVVRSLI